jgi:hypothetical protein
MYRIPLYELNRNGYPILTDWFVKFVELENIQHRDNFGYNTSTGMNIVMESFQKYKATVHYGDLGQDINNKSYIEFEKERDYNLFILKFL